MNDKDYIDDINKIEEKVKYQEEEKERRFPPFILLALFTTLGVLFALGLSFSAIKLIETGNPINTIISIIRGEYRNINELYTLIREASEKYFFDNGNLPGETETKTVSLGDLIDAGLITENDLKGFDKNKYDPDDTVVTIKDNDVDWKMDITLDKNKEIDDERHEYYYEKDETPKCLNCNGENYPDNGGNNNGGNGGNVPGGSGETYIITYVENYGNTSSGINLENQFPVPDSQGILFEGDNYVFNFALIIGKKTTGAYYEITAGELASNNLNPNYVKLYLEKNGVATSFSYKDSKVKSYTDYTKSQYNEATGNVIYSGYITENEAKSGKIVFKMKMWIGENAVVDENYSNKSFGVRVNTYAAFLGA